ncbi:hypothetical protein F5X68DRAFT_190196 [Plectosphaerella plurivora]|uniref:Uncharacterized protein n=1 Tax=Plectosphaerella plurivora TaxID=936078 RepID=A0A9P8VF34_9PEZI|nr:hypothetical protein F5X68DRAFT_190196 [Plectosphaerella plurivora]
MQQTKMTLGGVLAAGIIATATATSEQQCFTNIRSILSAGNDVQSNVKYLCDNFQEAIKQESLLSPCGTTEQAYDLFALLCGTSTPTPTEQVATPVTVWTPIATVETNEVEDVTIFEAITVEATPSAFEPTTASEPTTTADPTAFDKITGCTSHNVLDGIRITETVTTTFNKPSEPSTDATAGALSVQDICAPALIFGLGLCALLW